MMSPAGFEHGRLIVRLTTPLDLFVSKQKLGVVAGAETGFRIESDPDTVRAPDISFVRQSRVPVAAVGSYFPGAPDLAVEVLSPDDRASEVLSKVRQWLESGCQSVWVVDPRSQTVTRYSQQGAAHVFSRTDSLTDDLLPGFAVELADVFQR